MRKRATQAKTYGLLSGGDQQWKDWKKLFSIGNFLNEGSILGLHVTSSFSKIQT